jgi:phosphatidate cytidylyltransferase
MRRVTISGVLIQRLIFGGLLSTIILALLYADGRLSELVPHGSASLKTAQDWLRNGAIITIMILLFALLTTRELLRFARATGHSNPFPIVAYVFAAGLVLGPYVNFNLHAGARWSDESWGMMWLALALGMGFYIQATWRRSEHAMVNLASTIFIIFYAGGLAGFMTKLRMEVGGFAGMAVLTLSMIVVKMTDVGAYFVGRLTGRHKLIEWLSPKKTWEGFYGGYAVALACSLILGGWLHYLGIIPLGRTWLGFPGGLIVMGLMLATAAVAGDLFASLLKRDAAMKDSGTGLPGMGGVLDVMDSPLLGAPAAWFFWTRLIPFDQ